MSKLLFKCNDLSVEIWDIVELINGMVVYILGSERQNGVIGDNDIIIISTTPISSLTSTCFPCHIRRVIEHCGCFENCMDYLFKHEYLTQGNPLHIELKKEDEYI